MNKGVHIKGASKEVSLQLLSELRCICDSTHCLQVGRSMLCFSLPVYQIISVLFAAAPVVLNTRECE